MTCAARTSAFRARMAAAWNTAGRPVNRCAVIFELCECPAAVGGAR